MDIETLSKKSGIAKIKLDFYRDADLLPDQLTDDQMIDLAQFVDQMYDVGISLDKLQRYAHLQQKKCTIIDAQKALLHTALQQLAEKQDDLRLELQHLERVLTQKNDDESELKQLEQK